MEVLFKILFVVSVISAILCLCMFLDSLFISNIENLALRARSQFSGFTI